MCSVCINILEFKMLFVVGLAFCSINVWQVNALPFIFPDSSPNQVVNWTTWEDNWTPPLQQLLNFPNRTNIEPADSDHEFLEGLQQVKRKKRSRTTFKSWFDSLPQTQNNPSFIGKGIVIFNLFNEAKNSLTPLAMCTACKTVTAMLLYALNSKMTYSEILKLVEEYCVSLNVESARVCEGVSTLFGREVIYVLHRIHLRSDEICSFLLGDDCGDVYNLHHEWEVTFPQVPKPPVVEVPMPMEGAPLLKVLHISDTHYDPHYAEGSNAACNEPLCCRLSSGRATSPSAAAGKWGDYRKCDSPKRTVDNMLEHIADTHKDIDYILWTGDLPPHDVWNQTKEGNLDIIKETVRQMTEKFPGVPIFPALGNHESAPVNSFPPSDVRPVLISIAWLYDELDAQWRRWLPQSVSHTVRRGAFYSVLVRPGFRIISLNMNYCNNKNWWLLLNSTDPASELQWFIYELQNAEFSNEKVHVIGHIPPGHSDCLKVWSRNFYRIIHRYENIITAQFYGHTHYDEFEVFYDPQNLTHTTGIAYIGPSVSPYDGLNPGYRLYYIDGDHEKTTRLVVDHESWIMNLEEANLYDFPIWYKLYSARAAYNMKGLRPIDWNNLITKMTYNKELFDLYYKNYWKNSPVRPSCDDECRKRILCDCLSGRSHDRTHFCLDMESKIDDYSSWFVRGLALGGRIIATVLYLVAVP